MYRRGGSHNIYEGFIYIRTSASLAVDRSRPLSRLCVSRDVWRMAARYSSRSRAVVIVVVVVL